jgi:EAL domain-containing protein (putative c-di-GMP-specific phosphodiesterase class I)
MKTSEEGMRMNLEHAELRTLIDEGAFELYGQPKWTFGKNTCNTYEVFAEVLHLPGGETVPGYEYVRQIAYDGETSRAFSQWFLENTLGMMRRLTDRTGCELVAATNTWSHSINQPDFVETTMAALERHGFAPKNMEFELSEVDRLSQRGVDNLQALSDMGVKLLLDSFGIGRNNLFALNRLPLDGIKLPRSFAAGVPSDEKLVRILVSIAHLADTLGLTVCAKGIENGDQFEFFGDLGFWKGQGFMIGAPMAEKKLGEFIEQFGQKGPLE